MPTPEPQPFAAAPAFRKALLAWFARHRRPLPWRTEVSAYRTVVSELMCQQTQVATVLPYFERWVARWPGFDALARAREAEVLAAWAGLGYYTRARNLLALAQQVAGRPEPRTAADWQAFKGVGPYTAAAIASIAFGEPVAVVDGNVIRVLARVAGVRERFKDGAAAAKHFAGLAATLVDPRRPGDFNQAMMELGATVCRKAAPACDRCPVARWCDARARGDAPHVAAREVAEVDLAEGVGAGPLGELEVAEDHVGPGVGRHEGGDPRTALRIGDRRGGRGHPLGGRRGRGRGRSRRGLDLRFGGVLRQRAGEDEGDHVGHGWGGVRMSGREAAPSGLSPRLRRSQAFESTIARTKRSYESANPWKSRSK